MEGDSSANGDFICVQGRADAFPRRVTTWPAVWARIYTRGLSVCDVCMDDRVQLRDSISTCVRAFCFRQTLVDEGVFLLLPTRRRLAAGFSTNYKIQPPPVASVITPPIRATSEEEYQWVRRVRTTKLPWTVIYTYVDRALSWARSQFQKDETTHGQCNITATPYKYNYTLFSSGRWARQERPPPPQGGNWMLN